jgi:cell wall-associated NlpC family hydrolase
MTIKPGPLFRNEFFGAPYKLNGQSKEEGFDSFSLISNFYRELGNKFPDLSDLYLMYENEPEEAIERMQERLFEVTEEVHPGYMQVGDLVIFEGVTVDGFGNCPVIYLGNGIVGGILSDKGVAVAEHYHLEILQVRRGIKWQ